MARPALPGAWTVLAVVAAATCGGEPPADRATEEPDPVVRLLRPNRLTDTAPELFRVRLETTEGAVTLEVHRPWAPRGADRFYTLVNAGFYEGVTFHRVIDGFVAEFGIHPDPRVSAAWRDAIILDDSVRASNTRGRLTFAKGGPNSRTTQLFVNLRDNPSLDEEGFAPVGEVVEGMEVIEALYSGYGDGPPRGEGVYKAMALARGDAYLREEFPELDRIERAFVVENGSGG